MRFRFRFMPLGCLTLVSCAWLGLGRKAPKADDSTPKTLLIGRVASVPADRRFVLIQSYGVWNLPSGSVLVTRGPETQTANLLTTGESLGQFAAADVQSGTVAVGDAVFFTPPPTSKKPPQTPPTPPSPTTTPRSPDPPTSGNR